MTSVKICGIQSLYEAQAARAAGAWAVGFVFAPSRRNVTVDRAAGISSALGDSIVKVGVFVNENPDIVRAAARQCRLDYVQLHGEEDPDYLSALDLPAIKGFHTGGPVRGRAVKRWRADYYLFDGPRPGSGAVFDWNWLMDFDGREAAILAGGLHAGNVAGAIQTVRPMAVDVSSGVEYPEGGKDPVRIHEFMTRVKEADNNVPG